MLSQKKGLTAQLSQLVINSPIDARVLSLPVKVGQVVPSGATLATVGSQASFEVYAEILSDEIVRVKPGQIADVYFGARNGNSVTGKVKEIFPQALEKLSPLGVHQRRVPVVVTLDDNGPLKPGYEVKLSIRTDTRQNALLIPRESVSVEKDGSETVRMIKSGRVVVSKIATGLKNQFHVELLKGPAVGDVLLRDGSFLYREGSWVRATAE
jgi:HlyD family secretion protein